MSATALPNPMAATERQLAIKLGAFLALIALTTAACFLFEPAPVVTDSGVVMQWPDQVLGYTGKTEAPSPIELQILPADTEFAKKTYKNSANDTISAQIVLSGVEHRSIHRPEKCLEGQGWNVRNGEIVQVPLQSGRSLDVMVLDITRPVRTSGGATLQLPALYAYFFVSKDSETARHFDRIAITNLDLLFHNKAHRWAYVIVMAQVTKGLVPDGRDRKQTLQLIEDFIRETAPTFLKSEITTPAAKATGPTKTPR